VRPGDAALRRYVHGVGTDEPLVWYEGATVSDATRRYLHADHQGSIVAWSDAAGSTSGNTYTYGPYGEPQSWAGSRFRYTGQLAFSDAQIYHYKARAYDPIMGRFLQTDPIGQEDDPNLYAYVRNPPVDASDPTGLIDDDQQRTGSRLQTPGGAQVAGAGGSEAGPGQRNSNPSHAFFQAPVAVAPRVAPAILAGLARAGPVAVAAAGAAAVACTSFCPSNGPSEEEDEGRKFVVRVQAQGKGLSAQSSRVIHQNTPITAGQVLRALGALQAGLSRRDAAALSSGFTGATKFVNRVAAGGGVGPIPSQSFPRGGDHNQFRVDVEILVGHNIVPD
jgi:RHS repeat-associated protein